MTAPQQDALPTDYQNLIHQMKYARFNDKEGRRETWDETVDRYLDFLKIKVASMTPDGSHIIKDTIVSEEMWQNVREDILGLAVMPSMRAFMTAGPALARCNVAGYNCAYLPVDHPRSFDEALYILMCGTGVGFSCESANTNKLPVVPTNLVNSGHTIEVADSKQGWAAAYRSLLRSLWDGYIPQWDVSKVRPAGSRLKTFGGRASGPDPLVELFTFTIEKFRNAAGRKLRPIEVHDIMCKIGDVVVVGGVRRSALISLSDEWDTGLREAKMGSWWEGNPHRALSNNSIAYTCTPTMRDFMEEWLAIYTSKSGERGLFNRQAATNIVARNGRRDTNHEFGCNPCCFVGDTLLLTADGYKTMRSLASLSDVDIISSDGDITEGKVWSSGIRPIVEVKFTGDRKSLKCTPDHIFQTVDGDEVEAAELTGRRLMPYFNVKTLFEDKDAVAAGFVQGDGNTSRLKSPAHKGLEVFVGNNDAELADYFGGTGSVYSRYAASVAIKYGLSSEKLPDRSLPNGFELLPDDFYSGLFSANGCVVKAGRVGFKTTCETLAEQIAHVLATRGIQSYITTNKPTDVQHSNGVYTSKQSYDVNITRFDSLVKFAERISFVQKYKQEALGEIIKKKAPYVRSVVSAGSEEVFDFTEPKNHWGVVEGVVAHNSEIILRPYQFCNLSEVVVRNTDNMYTLSLKVQCAAFLGTLQSTLTDFKYLRSVWKNNTEEERLLGVSLTGVYDLPALLDNPECLQELRNVAINTNIRTAEALGIPRSTACTCVKPSGTVSQLVDAASGCHPRYSAYYVRTVRADNHDPLTQFLKDQGVPCEPCVMKPDHTSVFSFPMKSPDGAVLRDELTAVEQLENWLTLQEHWCEHKPSVTIYVREHEWLEVGAWVYENFDVMSGVSFLPHSDHSYKQAPYQEIDKSTYEQLSSAMPKVNWSKLREYESEDNTKASQELACMAGVCEIVSVGDV